MIISPLSNQYTTAIAKSISDFTGCQICVTFKLPSTICTFDAIELINTLLKNIYSEYRQINRRANVESFLVVLGAKLDRSSLCTVFMRHSSHLLEKTVTERSWMIQEVLEEVDGNANVFKPYRGLENDIQRVHLKDLAGSYSVNLIQASVQLKLEDCAEY